MKNLFKLTLLVILISNVNSAFGQDTLRLKNRNKLVCKVQKISETEIEYKKWENIEGPIYTIDINKVFEIVFENGTIEKIIPDEMSVSKELDILDKRNAIKFDIFSPVFDKVTLGFEHSVRVGWNLEGYISLIHNKLLPNSVGGNMFGNSLAQGLGLKFGNKFFLGSDYYLKGTKYAHPLKGRFVRIDLSFSQFSINNVYVYSQLLYNGMYYYTSYDKGHLDVSQIGVSVCYGRQFILGNMFTLQYNVGIGYVGSSENFTLTQANVVAPSNYNNYYHREGQNEFGALTNVVQLGDIPLGVSANLSLGYIIGKSKRKSVVEPK